MVGRADLDRKESAAWSVCNGPVSVILAVAYMDNARRNHAVAEGLRLPSERVR